jgi:amino acid adenylation domain-containing protein
MTFIAGYAALLFRYTGQDDIIIGSPIADRNHPETKNLIGFLLNTLPLRIRPSDEMSFRELLQHTREVCLGAHSHQEVPYETLLQRLHLSRDLSATPLFQTMLVLLNTPAQSMDPNGLWGKKVSRNNAYPDQDFSVSEAKVFKEDCHNGTTKFDLSFVMEEGQVFCGTVEYNTDLFDHETIASLVERLQILMQAAAADPTRPITELPLMTEAQQERLLAEWSGRPGPRAHIQGIHQLIEAQAERTPQAIAVEIDGKQLTYGELNARANQLARWIQRLGARPERLVGIFLERSQEMLVAMLAALKAGAGYLPLDPSYPRQRLAFMQEDCNVEIILTSQALAAELPQDAGHIVRLDSESAPIANESPENLPCNTWPENQVCAFYTSGSTGRPKGVAITHGALINYTLSAVKAYALKADDRVLQFASMSFDASLEEIYPCLAVGGTLVLRTDEMMDSIAKFASRCGEAGITLLPLPTAYWHEIVAWQESKNLKVEEMLPTVRLVIIGGERALPDRVAAWRQSSNGQMVLVNTYGPTEGTIVVTRYKITGAAPTEADGKEVPIGWPIENAKVYVLDSWNQPVPPGIAGELHIGGAALARGYLNRPDLTAEKFVPDAFSGQAGARLYKTGDLVRFLPDGCLEYRGRTDHQVKIRGYRIEPGEIEATLEKHEAVKDVVVAVREDDPGLKRLVAYVVFRDGVAVSPADLRGFLKPKLPDYMLPAAFVFLQKLPVTAGGKVNRQALPKPDRSRADVKGELVGPRTPTEEIVASVWKTVLKLDRIGIHENFFELGGHSLLATQIVARIGDALHIDLPLRRLFEALTIAELSMVVDQLVEAGASEKPRIVSVRRFQDTPANYLETQSGSENGLDPSSHHVATALAPDPNMDHMLAGLEGLTDQEVKALLGEEDEIETNG